MEIGGSFNSSLHFISRSDKSWMIWQQICLTRAVCYKACCTFVVLHSSFFYFSYGGWHSCYDCTNLPQATCCKHLAESLKNCSSLSPTLPHCTSKYFLLGVFIWVSLRGEFSSWNSNTGVWHTSENADMTKSWPETSETAKPFFLT